MHHFGTKFSLGISFIVRQSYMLSIEYFGVQYLDSQSTWIAWQTNVSNPFVVGRKLHRPPPPGSPRNQSEKGALRFERRTSDGF